MVTEDIIVKCLAGEAEPHEIAMVEQWRKSGEDNEKRYQQLQKLWDHSAGLRKLPSLNLDKAWEKVNARTSGPSKGRVVSMRTYWAVAASLVLLFGLGLLFFRSGDPKTQMLSANTLQGQQDLKLSDGSRVVLRSGEFEYPASFEGTGRKVILKKGTAFFDIAPNKAKPFEISCNESKVTVLGTEFEVNEDENSTRVLVREGKVRFTCPGKEVILTAGMGAEYDKKSGLLKSTGAFASNQFLYATHMLEFKESNIEKVRQDLEAAFPGKEIVLENIPVDCKISTTFEIDEGFGRVVAVVAATISAEFVITEDGQKAYIKGGVCR